MKLIFKGLNIYYGYLDLVFQRIVEIERRLKKRKFKRKIDYESMANAYAEALPNQEEDHTYIEEMKKVVNNRK